LAAGFRLGSREAENRRTLKDFLDEPFVRVVATDEAVAARYGEVFASLRRAGTPIPINDVWIAAATFETGGHLLTFDSDFARVSALSCTVFGS
jgi:predicted nucleic acid-binding protein